MLAIHITRDVQVTDGDGDRDTDDALSQTHDRYYLGHQYMWDNKTHKNDFMHTPTCQITRS